MVTDGHEPITVLYVGERPERGTVGELASDDGPITVVGERTIAAARERLAADAESVDCVLSRHELPDGDGLELLSAVRADHGDLPFVLYTDAGSEALASEAIAAGVTDYVRRDPDDDQAGLLATRIQNAVAARRARSEQRRQLDAIETADEGISILDGDGRFVYVNQAYADLYDYDRTELLGEHWALIYPDDEVGRTRDEILPTVEREGHWHGETTGLRADGSTFVEDHTVAKTADGDLVCTVRDVTEQRERERALEAQRRELALKERAMDEAPVGIVVTDPHRQDNPMVYCNDEFLRLTGYEEAEVLGRNCRFLQGRGTEEESVAELRRAIEAEEPVTVELRNYRKDGTEFWNRVSVAPVRDDEGEVTHYVGFQQDVSERQEPTRQLHVLHRVLRHNLANSMNLVRGTAELVAERTEGTSSEAAESIVAEVDDLLDVIDRHRTVVRMLGDRPSPRRLDLDAVVEEAARGARASHPGAEVTVRGDGGVVTAVPAIQMAIDELVDNAVAASSSDPPSVEIRVETDEAVCRVQVADDGPGLPPEEQLVLTGDQEVDPLYHGVGMGLWVVYWVVTLSGGTVDVTVDDGTTVTVTLPREDVDRVPDASDVVDGSL